MRKRERGRERAPLLFLFFFSRAFFFSGRRERVEFLFFLPTESTKGSFSCRCPIEILKKREKRAVREEREREREKRKKRERESKERRARGQRKKREGSRGAAVDNSSLTFLFSFSALRIRFLLSVSRYLSFSDARFSFLRVLTQTLSLSLCTRAHARRERKRAPTHKLSRPRYSTLLSSSSKLVALPTSILHFSALLLDLSLSVLPPSSLSMKST